MSLINFSNIVYFIGSVMFWASTCLFMGRVTTELETIGCVCLYLSLYLLLWSFETKEKSL